ncbi:ABC transporter ATP-binding protein [Microbacterium sp. CFBP 8790]|uniref:dipeptide ABC transporter ATP-binding protein n=1 Tax=unclassified Microbacterium TaxID=2609290 RepID=UPI00177DCB24|nr:MULTISPECIES: ABC transporter ATP-binding protein [unclassified Microbacterium]MBD8205772.1 ABC transporter ATP-binding protein [Microbacterium sp. CFBP 8801]MBD8509346.1 ABC transporter ATP-binding protein [Microbacterium sp. CFBP 8790]
MTRPVLSVENLRLDATTDEGHRTVVHDVSFEVAPSSALGVVGESGSGKSLTMLAALGLLPPGVRVASGSVCIDGRDVTSMSERELRSMRGRVTGMVFQDPMSALNPLRSVGAQVAAAVRAHSPATSRTAARRRAVELLQSVGVRDAADRAASRPHQWSGGMRQRAVIAMAIANDPLLLIADEPTTALDVTVQAQVMALLDDVRERTGSALALISHDLGLVAQHTDDLVVMRSGRVVEHGETRAVLSAPAHEYTRRLLAAAPSTRTGADRPALVETAEEPALEVTDLVVEYPGRRGRRTRAVDGVSLRIRAGETVAVVGESGCGKSSLLRAILGLTPASAGTIRFEGRTVSPDIAGRSAEIRSRAQVVFQDPSSALDPRMSVARSVGEPLKIRRSFTSARVRTLLDGVGLDSSFDDRLPTRLSGGQRQRVGIARALALDPAIVLLDEPVSALDVSIQAQVLDLLGGLQREQRLAYLFVSHDLGVVRGIADRVVVMQAGRIVEEGPTERVFAEPRHPYTRTLLDAIPHLFSDSPTRPASPTLADSPALSTSPTRKALS